MSSLTREQCEWLIRPLLDAGLGLERARDLLVRLGFEDIVSEGRGTVAQVSALVADQSAAVQAGWADVIGRMLALDSRR